MEIQFPTTTQRVCRENGPVLKSLAPQSLPFNPVGASLRCDRSAHWGQHQNVDARPFVPLWLSCSSRLCVCFPRAAVRCVHRASAMCWCYSGFEHGPAVQGAGWRMFSAEIKTRAKMKVERSIPVSGTGKRSRNWEVRAQQSTIGQRWPPEATRTGRGRKPKSREGSWHGV